MGARYEIPDEPKAGPLAHFTCTPGATFLGFMLGGTWLGLPWMVFNGFAMGSATRRVELLTGIATLVAQLVVMAAIVALVLADILPPSASPYGGLVVQATRLVGAYRIFLLQERSFELHRYFGGAVWRHGWTLAIVLFAIRIALLAQLGGGWLTVGLML